VKPKDGHGGPTPSDLHASEAAFEDARQQSAKLQDLPEIDFATFVLSLSHSAYVHLGDAPDPSNGKQEVDLPMARQTIELLALLQEKTKNNLSGEEERVLEQGLYDLRMRYVEVSKRK
jgi:hypothetical protein